MSQYTIVRQDDTSTNSEWTISADILNNLQGLIRKTKSRISFYYDQNTNATQLTQNVWTKFADVSGPVITVMNSNNDFTVDNTLRITYTGTEPKWFNISAVTNVRKVTGGVNSRTLDLQWRLNGVPVGIIRESQSNSESNIYTGIGDLPLSSGDYLEPFCQNVENNDDVIWDNASFSVEEIILDYLAY